ncbi:MFS transporter [Pseudonocardia sp. WMMC193]|uniref:MFS transporter n=1 Tax=Pseudonocardia sp. WMMC193 TaxID=2911965 RepID=UPI001F3717D7|nr:MFS transporter [Pseudonocardia sp. WMMC193]MCF7547469.1 MHS family MFS transporter [Pseudonocardia sp. WMMC193]
MTSPAPSPHQTALARRVARASFIGTTIEWYDFFIYATAAALVFGPQFFPTGSTLASTLAAYSTLAVGFIARPIGGIIMGHFGDRVGRKQLLVFSLLLMGAATFLIGLLPGYATIGVWAPILLVLLRFAQGIGVGGEWGGAVLMAVEHAPPRKRTFYGSFPQMGLPAGIIVSNLVFLVINQFVSQAQFASWGWRIPFLLSAALVVFGLIIRLRIMESPEFAAMKDDGRVARRPLIEVVRRHPRQLLLTSGASIAAPALGYLVLVYLLGYGTTQLGLGRSTMLTLIIIGSVTWMLAIVGSAALADRVGRKPVFLAGAALATVWSVPFFLLVDTAQPVIMAVSIIIATTGVAVMAGPQAALIADVFPVHIRYSGTSTAYQVGSVLGGAVAPLAATALFAAYDSSAPIGLYMAAMGLITLVSMAALSVPAAARSTSSSQEALA